MFKYFAKLLAAGKVKFEHGFVVVAGQRMLFLPDNVVIEVQKGLQKELGAQQGANKTYQLFREGGKHIADAVRTQVQQKGGEIVKWMAEVASGSGWGKITLIDFNDKLKKTMLSVENSPFIEHYPKTNEPICYITKALIAGTLSSVFKEEIEGVEIECMAMGNKKCVMVFQPREEWKKVESTYLKNPAMKQLPELFV